MLEKVWNKVTLFRHADIHRIGGIMKHSDLELSRDNNSVRYSTTKGSSTIQKSVGVERPWVEAFLLSVHMCWGGGYSVPWSSSSSSWTTHYRTMGVFVLQQPSVLLVPLPLMLPIQGLRVCNPCTTYSAWAKYRHFNEPQRQPGHDKQQLQRAERPYVWHSHHTQS